MAKIGDKRIIAEIPVVLKANFADWSCTKCVLRGRGVCESAPECVEIPWGYWVIDEESKEQTSEEE